MGSTGLGDALFTKTQQRVLAVLFGAPDRSFYLNEIVRLSGAGNGAVHRELSRLLACGIVTAGLIGNQKHFQANRASPIFEELLGIVTKTFGLVDVLRARLATLAGAIQVAFVYGSMAKGTDKAASDIDLLVVSDEVSYPDVLAALDTLHSPVGREVNPSIYRRVEFEKKASEEGGFLSRVLEGPKLFLIGAESDIPKPRATVARERRPAAHHPTRYRTARTR
jgi:predicted nucleotidyltransferase